MTLTVNNRTLSGNSATTFQEGGGILNNGNGGNVALTLNNSTLSGNLANFGGGIYQTAASGTATLEIANSVLANSGTLANIDNNSGTVTSHGYNLSSDNGRRVPDCPWRSDQYQSVAWPVAGQRRSHIHA